MAKVIVVTSGKGGVGKTTSSASVAAGLAMQGYKTVAIDFDVGLRNLDLVMGCERRVVYDLVNVVKGEATLRQALIGDKRQEKLHVLPASQTRDKDALDFEGVGRVMQELVDMGFDYIICDSPAGIEKGAQLAMYYADEAIIVTNPEVSSVRDSDRIVGLLDAKTRRAKEGLDPIKCHLLVSRYNPQRAERGEMLSIDDILELLGIELLGAIPESQSVLNASNQGIPVVLEQESDAGAAYMDAVKRFLGEEQPHRFLEVEKKGFFSRLFSPTPRNAYAG
ncbi:MAG: septum site-determining protein MinD [Myxococcales bacterium]|nr:septum site-determining protein MinD [Myxococcales bacterium]